MIRQDRRDGGSADLVAQTAHDVAKARVAPTGVVVSKLHHEGSSVLLLRWSARPTPCAAVVFPGDKLSVPAQDRARRHQARILLQQLPSEELPLGREPTALVIGEAQTATVELVGAPMHGTVAVDLDGGFVYRPDPGFHGVDSFLYRVTDGAHWSSAATATIDVTKVDKNLPPVARPDEHVVVQGRLVTIPAPGVLENDSDPEGHPLTALPLSLPTLGTSAPIAGGGFTYAAPPGVTGEDVFTYVVSDGEKTSAPTTVTIRVVSSTGACRPRAIGGRLPGGPSARWRPRLCEHGWFGVPMGY